jgi:hypothetical protein
MVNTTLQEGCYVGIWLLNRFAIGMHIPGHLNCKESSQKFWK